MIRLTVCRETTTSSASSFPSAATARPLLPPALRLPLRRPWRGAPSRRHLAQALSSVPTAAAAATARPTLTSEIGITRQTGTCSLTCSSPASTSCAPSLPPRSTGVDFRTIVVVVVVVVVVDTVMLLKRYGVDRQRLSCCWEVFSFPPSPSIRAIENGFKSLCQSAFGDNFPQSILASLG